MKTISMFVPACIVAMAVAGCTKPPRQEARSPDKGEAPSRRPLKVFILAGQSNMQGHARVTTFDHIGMDPKTAPMLEDMRNADGTPRVLDDVYISAIGIGKEGEVKGKLAAEFGARGRGDKIGPEYTFGIYMHKALEEPILIIKTAWGGKSLCFDFRSPSAGEWTPPPGHPDLVKEELEPLPIPDALDLPADYKPGREHLNPYARHLGFFMFKGLRGCAIGEHNGVHPIYIVQDAKHAERKEAFPLKTGDIILGIEGSGLRENPKIHWRKVVYGDVVRSDHMLTVARWRAGRIESIDIDLAEFSFPGGRADLPEELKKAEERRLEHEKNKGHYYRLMMDHVEKVLADIKSVHPGYDPEHGHEIAGFVWFQGWNDMVDSGTYPNRDKPKGYEQYSWLLAHFIRDVRKDLGAPDMPFVIGVMGVDGETDKPNYFRQAMAAPAGYPEFKGTVAAVHTARYWDDQLADLSSRGYKIGLKQRELQVEKGLEGEELKKAVAEYRATVFTPEEEEILRKGASNAGFHYLGSAKIMGQIGKGFAEAMLGLLKN